MMSDSRAYSLTFERNGTWYKLSGWFHNATTYYYAVGAKHDLRLILRAPLTPLPLNGGFMAAFEALVATMEKAAMLS